MDAPKNKYVDHINGNSLDNRKSNLRLCSHGENKMNSIIAKNNTSGYKGVSYHIGHKKWVTTIQKNKKVVFRKEFNNKKDAAIAYNINALKYHQQFANINIC